MCYSDLTRSITNNGGVADLILNTDGSVMKTGSFFVSGGTFTAAANGGTLTITGGGGWTNLNYNATAGRLLASNATINVALGDSAQSPSGWTNINFEAANDTSVFTPVNVGSYTFTNFYGSAVITTVAEAVDQTRLWLIRAPTNNSFFVRMFVRKFGPVRAANFTHLVGLALAEDTNATIHAYSLIINNSAPSGLRNYSYATPTSSRIAETGGTAAYPSDPNVAPNYLGLSGGGLHMRFGYTSNTTTYTTWIDFPSNGMTQNWVQVGSKTNCPAIKWLGIMTSTPTSSGQPLTAVIDDFAVDVQ